MLCSENGYATTVHRMSVLPKILAYAVAEAGVESAGIAALPPSITTLSPWI
jgi:hypothetical protein